jgi:uncharacterized membrane protein
MSYLPLVGLVVVAVGFALRLRVTIVVLAAGLVTGIVAKMPAVGTDAAPGVLDTLGRAFAGQRLVTLFVLALPAIGLSERYGLQEQARRLIARVRAATAGRLQLVYQLFRVGLAALGIRLGSGHVTFSRPLVVPMAIGAARLDEECDGDEVERVKAASGASENYGNFFGQNLFFGAAGVALVVTTLRDNGVEVDPRRVALWTIPVALASVVVAAGQYLLLDRWLRRRARTRATGDVTTAVNAGGGGES